MAGQSSTPKYVPQGYQRLARIMSKEKSLAIFRRFDDVLMLTLMRLQAEIMDMQSIYLYQVELDQQSGSKQEELYSLSFAKLQASQNSHGKQIELLDSIGKKLREYNDLLLQASQLSKLDQPLPHDLDQLQGWLRDPLGGGNFQSGSELRIWHDSHDPDFARGKFVSLAPNVGEKDFFTTRISEFVTHGFHHVIGERLKLGTLIDEESGLTSYDASKIDQAASFITTIISSVLPVMTILILYQIQSPYGRIGATIGFTAAFAGALALFTTARRVEILAATAAFAAVEVVFIGSAL